MSKKQSSKASLNPKYRDICESLDWTIREYDDGTVEVCQASPAGEDFFFTANVKNFPQEVERYADDFDPDEHIEMWIEARKHGTAGVPTTRELVHDAEAIQKMLKELAEALTADNKSTIGEQVAAYKEEQE